MTLKPEHTMRVLIDRLNWPIRLVRWQAAKEFAALFSSPERALATRVFLGWLRSRQLETEVVAGMAVLMCAEPADLPPADDVKRNVKKSSILADFLFQKLYHKPLGGWLNSHSGPAPTDYQAETYFNKHKGQVIPLILATDFQRLQDEKDLPFQEQWAFEWRKIMDTTNSPYSTYPYYFMGQLRGREGISGQFSQRQCDVYRSAFLRTLAFAVQQWGMPPDHALVVAARCLPLSRGLHALRPIARPTWLRDIPEKCCRPDASLEKFARQLIKAEIGTRGMRPVSLRIPISNAVAEFGELSIESFYATQDFTPKSDFVDDHTRILLWPTTDLISFEGLLPAKDIEECRILGAAGSCIPVCLNTWPLRFGFWQNDYIHLGFSFPAPYNFNAPLRVEMAKGWVEFSSAERRIGYWKTWHDNWVPVHANDGHTRCGGLTELNTSVLEKAKVKLGMALAWQATLRLWERDTEYSAPKPITRSAFFRE